MRCNKQGLGIFEYTCGVGFHPTGGGDIPSIPFL